MDEQLTENFNLSEFECRCGCEMPPSIRYNIDLLAEALQQVRTYLGEPLVITSGYRCPAHNKAVGGAKGSYHMTGRAVDIDCPAPALKFRLVHAGMQYGFWGIGIAKTFVHLDLRKTKQMIFTYG